MDFKIGRAIVTLIKHKSPNTLFKEKKGLAEFPGARSFRQLANLSTGTISGEEELRTLEEESLLS